MRFVALNNGKVAVVGIRQSTIIFADNDEAEDTLDRETIRALQIIKGKNESVASNYGSNGSKSCCGFF